MSMLSECSDVSSVCVCEWQHDYADQKEGEEEEQAALVEVIQVNS